MIADLQPYPEYKESGLPWLGEVPEHWEVRRGRQLFEIRKRIANRLGIPVISVTQRGLVVKDVDSFSGQMSQDYSKYQFVLAGELAMNSMDLLTGGVGIATSTGVTSPDYRVFCIRDNAGCESKYVLYVLRLLYQNRTFYAWGQGSAQLGRWRLPRKSFNDFPFPVPPPGDQAAIWRFLDWANGRLERAIRAKRKQLALFRERVLIETEQALRSDGVVMKRLSTIANLKSPRIDRRSDEIYTRIGLYNRGRGIFHKPSVPGADLGDSEFFRISTGDLVISGQFAWEGAVALARPKDSGCIASHRYPILRGEDGVASSAFLFSFFRSAYGAMLLDHHSRGAAGRNRPLNAQRLLKEQIPVPTVAWQERIEFLLEQEYAIGQSVERMIGIISEYRTRLVADVVTGKLDVRAAAAQLPEETPPEPAEEDADLGGELEAEFAEASTNVEL